MKDSIKKIGLRVGFARVGITTAEPLDDLGNVEASISSGHNALMRWLARAPERRVDPSSLLTGAKSVICCALAYGDCGLGKSCEGVDLERARFARGGDYHEIVRAKLKEFWGEIKKEHPDARAKLCVDTSPILEKALAARSGIGWIGKHTILINEELGSWFVLGEIVTDIEIEPDMPAENKCGDCSACMDGCPTSAIISPNVLDARRCISYLTIEAPRTSAEVPSHDLPTTDHGFSYGCDICQEVCPYNKCSDED
jgi:epoxyqueuosine reductase